ncbi:MAG: 1-acyl-sn-glycerol-3-phosphate acyltransferase [Rhodobacteraceae bacterium]|nr:1-acyl-sn-glycerol-3-phosphate acyltransferase [Paracoccaceae bacterium]
MSVTWRGAAPPEAPRITIWGWLRAGLRGAALGLWVFGGLVLLLLVRLAERPFHGVRRPWTPAIASTVCRGAFPVIGTGFQAVGAPLREPGAVVANHSSWLDIFALNARKRIYFVSKAEVSRWPAIGWLARATGTVFITREVRDAPAQARLFEARLRAGHRLLFFPEGTSSDGRRVLPFKSTLFEAFFTQDLQASLAVQPVSVIYRAPDGADPRFYAWWGDMGFGAHLLRVLAARRQGRVTVLYHPPLKVADYSDRKALAAACEAAVRAGLEAELARDWQP